ncbi:hypothetical protein [Flavobacterium muglaense]|uniref:Lipoprotein n=1 Tax=Flavobacterium muglaense TaxID=2764716 RepID=A0A923N0Z6_9FLAO|nr:hypothetical protein [Flavobacterium muglaense]MBC5838235.1 hypothetical protein [Flavobacterium muglaense]MBC5844770.1 hypothetical protein [Flavobacterium muglaense]
MKKTLIISTLLVLCSCGQETKQTKTALNTITRDSTVVSPSSATNGKINHQTIEKEIIDRNKNQDLLTNEMQKAKENKILKESFLQEMYAKKVVTISNDSIVVNIPFNLHGPDCGAPDCYSNDIRFSFKLKDKLLFPMNIRFTEHENGCVEKEQKLLGSFQLVEENSNHVIYYSTKYKRTLVLFSTDKRNGTSAFYFTGLEKNRITGQNVNNIKKEYNEDDKNSIYPFTSSALTTNKY